MTDSTVLAQSSDSASAIQDAPGVSISAGPGGLRRHVPGRWTTLNVGAANPTDGEVERSIIVSVGDQSRLQYERRMWIPPGARRQAWLPAQIPADIRQDQIQVPLSSMRLKQDGKGEQFQANFVGEPISKRSLLVDHDQSVVTVIIDRKTDLDPAHPVTEFQRRLVYAARERLRLSEQDLLLPEFSSDRLPPHSEAFDAVDQVVLGSDRLFHDSAAVKQLSQWLHSGGRLWIMLDRVDLRVVRQLLGDQHCFSAVDQVQLNEFELQRIDVVNTRVAGNKQSWSSESPATMVRVYAETDDISARVDGWPAAFWQSVGEGEVLITTLDASGWFENGDSAGKPMVAFQGIANRFFDLRLAAANHLDDLTPIVDKQIGYTIPTRRSIATVLGLHAMVLLVIGLVLMNARQLQWLAVAVPLMALLATVSLLTIGSRQSGDIEPIVATGQVVSVSSDGSHSRVETIAAIFSDDRQPLPIVSAPDTKTELLIDPSDSEMKRIVWDDSGRSSWRFVTQRPGTVQHTRSVSVAANDSPVTVIGSFDSDGFVASIDALETVDDPVVVSAATPSLAINPSSDTSGQFTGSVDDVLPPGRFIKDGLMSQAQQSRQQFLRQVLTVPRNPTGPALLSNAKQSVLVWSNSLGPFVSYGDGYDREGWSLVSIPIQLRRPPPGQEFQIPATFVKLDSYVGASGASTIYDPRTGTWLSEMTKAKRVALRCLLPPEVLPCRVTKMSVAIKINAPSRTLTVESVSDKKPVVMFEKTNPTGLQTFDIEDDALLQQASPGELTLAVSVSATDEELSASGGVVDTSAAKSARELTPSTRPNPSASSSRSEWNIQYMHVNVYATSE